VNDEARWQRLGELFEAALDLPPAQRSEWLRAACPDDDVLRQDIERMLAAHGRAGILDRPVSTIASRMLPQTPVSEPRPELGYVGRFRLIREIGRGGMGVVYQAHDTLLDRFLAVKILAGSAGEVKELGIAEAKAAAALDHRNICAIHDIGETGDGRLYIAMAYYEGLTVAQKLRNGPLPMAEALEIAAQAANGLARAHEAGIVHRDIKSSNLLVTDRGETKILDFGIAKLEGSQAPSLARGRVGTVHYMSPEQTRGGDVDHRTDLWSLGVVLYEMLTGQLPFRGETVTQLFKAIQQDDPPQVPAAAEAVLARALAKSHADRYQSAGEFLADLVALKAASGRRPPAGDLPVPLTSIVAREREIEQVGSLLKTQRLVTLTGPAGTGKTRLSLEVARTVQREFADGVFFVELAPLHDPALLPSAIARALRLAPAPALPPVEWLEASLRDKQVLVVLDNFEQIVAGADLVSQLLTICPGLRVLATSRVPLRIGGEHEFPLAPLALPDSETCKDLKRLEHCPAIALFTERVRAVIPDFRLHGDTARAVAELCIRLDGLPLAIELAAARIKLLSPRAMLRRLESRLDLLKSGARDRPARHQTLRHAIGWSYDLLGEEEQRLFRRLAVFAGGCTLEAIEAVCECPDALDGLATLVDHSLVRRGESRGEEPQFSLLETIRLFGLDKLREAGEEDALCEAHASYFAELAERAEPELTRSQQGAWFDRLEEEHDNFRAALAWASEHGATAGLRIAASLWRFWIIRGYLHEGRKHLEALLSSAAESAPPLVRARAWNGLGTIAHNLGDLVQSRRCLEESLDLFRDREDRRGVAAVLTNLAWVAMERSDFRTGWALSEEALRMNRDLGEVRGEALALNNLGWIANYRGEYQAARSFHEQSLELRRRIGDRRGVAFALTSLAWAEQYHGDYARAKLLLAGARRIVEEINDKVILAFTHLVAAYIEHDMGELDRAKELAEQAAVLGEQSGNRSLLAGALLTLGAVLRDGGDHPAAAERLERALEHFRALGSLWSVTATLCNQGMTELARGNIERAGRLLIESLDLHRSLEDKLGAAECLEALAELAVAQREWARAADHLREAQSIRERIAAPVPPRRRAAIERCHALCVCSGR
jgi:predicted ATPase